MPASPSLYIVNILMICTIIISSIQDKFIKNKIYKGLIWSYFLFITMFYHYNYIIDFLSLSESKYIFFYSFILIIFIFHYFFRDINVVPNITIPIFIQMYILIISNMFFKVNPFFSIQIALGICIITPLIYLTEFLIIGGKIKSNLKIRSTKVHEFRINTFEYIKIPLQQYLTFFPKYVQKTKNKIVLFEVISLSEGLLIRFESATQEEIDLMVLWFNEYLNFTKQDLTNPILNYDHDVNSFQVDILITQLKNQVTHLKNSIDLAKLKYKLKSDQLKYITSLSEEFSNLFKSKKNVSKEEINAIKKHISKGEIELAIKGTYNIVNKYSLVNLESKIIAIYSRLNNLKAKDLKGTLNNNEIMIEQNKITQNLLEIIKTIV